MTTPARPDLNAIKRRVVLPGSVTKVVTLSVAERDALVAWVEHLEAEIAARRDEHTISERRRWGGPR